MDNYDIYQWCVTYHEGGMSREELYDKAVHRIRSTVIPSDPYDEADDIRVSIPGSADEIVDAFYDGLIDGDLYTEIITAVS